MSNKFRSISLIAAVLSILTPATLQAQDGFQVDEFEPVADQHNNILGAFGSDVISSSQSVGFSGGLFYHYAHEPLSLTNLDTNESTVVINGQHKVEPWVGMGVYDLFDIGVVVPIAINDVSSASNPLGADVGSFAVGDIRVSPKFRILDHKDFGGFGLAIAAPLYLPTGDPKSYTGQGSFRAEPRLGADFTTESGLKIAANIGYQIRSKELIGSYVSDDLLRWNLATNVPLGVADLSVIGSVFGDLKFADNQAASGDTESKSNYPIELLAGLRYQAAWGLQAQLGGGLAVHQGIGAPVFRVLTSIGYQYTETDPDQDGLFGSADSCPDDPEDKDGFEDQDGCPDPDNDQDKVLDGNDQCEGQLEDHDGFADEDGCPDPDNDEDLILDANDGCPNVAEDLDGFQDEDGCLDEDNDNDTLLDADDTCPNVAEDLDGFQDADGCPDVDNDGDGFCDPFVSELNVQTDLCKGLDQCPEEKELINNFEDDDGCPDEGESSVTITKKTIDLEEEIYFDTNKATIKAVSNPILDQVATVLETNPSILKISLEGHTDDVGKDDRNLTLSQDRVNAVMDYLVSKGIDKSRMSAKGFGESKPLVDTTGLKGSALRDARSKNRRVEIKILELAK